MTKSGSTVETLTNFHILIELLKKYQLDYKKYIVVTTDQNSSLDQWAQHEDITCLHVPALVGGRYSVFSEVGLFPLGFIGIDIEHLHTGARDAVEAALKKENDVIKGALAIYHAYQDGLIIHDLFIFALASILAQSMQGG